MQVNKANLVSKIFVKNKNKKRKKANYQIIYQIIVLDQITMKIF